LEMIGSMEVSQIFMVNKTTEIWDVRQY
jgi:hypothetical protein